MPSFDIVSEVDVAQLKNAVDNANRELEQRFDFRGVKASFSFEKGVAKLNAEYDTQLRQLLDILRTNVIKRGIEASSMDTETATHSSKSWSQTIKFKEGVDKETAKKLIKLVKDKKLKVQIALQGEQLRVTGKKRDDLQAVMTVVKAAELGQPFQFNNFRD
ncbi:nucleotide-binding protein [Psychromonas sp. CNPT3]|uniref:YajQ family cyclic di-GMP-binding protein n=1 Tax=Psychromonas sp. CNPT3 TaxID=314282 RepID=UPI00006E990B|nr:YajQ family cyclic di-GMP-binding protein [Psychromonas sp. CNPT3]AGH81379.1 nucleotide-binding protein [Psychromonas sp. CNPT3]